MKSHGLCQPAPLPRRPVQCSPPMMNLFHHLILPPPAFWFRLSSRACSGFRIFAIARISGSATNFKKSRTHEVSRSCHRTDKCERNEGRSCFDLEAHPCMHARVVYPQGVWRKLPSPLIGYVLYFPHFAPVKRNNLFQSPSYNLSQKGDIRRPALSRCDQHIAHAKVRPEQQARPKAQATEIPIYIYICIH